ncbi:heavy metal-binding domain-containing protein [Baekduia soli]|uniref:Heavy metal-binding domain-containing protein n=1 Tax=Baekduia soli TaxID=496014 RepID=A0A5B8U4K4_9ACTN|nr:heavy metal-binding domain-containing protein [Baekduia soli]QEC47815.1 heavy metal-binding domain-containing protein [Baekduia soli]
MSDDAAPVIPQAARERLGRRRTQQGPGFDSALGVGEALAVREAGLRPVCQVMGTSYYQVGWQNMPWGSARGGWFGVQGTDGQTFELESQTDAFNEARRLAVDRLRQEAVLAGADAVVGVQVRRSTRDWAGDLVEFVAVGTAVRSERYDLGDEPLLCNLSGQDVAKLVRHGFWPVGIVGGSTVAYVVTGTRQQWRSGGLLSGRRNQELPDFTQGLYDARALAMERVTRGAHELQAHGVVGVQVERSMHPREREVNNVTYHDMMITLHVLGTAIVEVADAPVPPEKFIALPLT